MGVHRGMIRWRLVDGLHANDGRRLGGTHGEEGQSAGQQGQGRQVELGDRADRGGQVGGEDGSQDEDALVQPRLQGVGGVEQIGLVVAQHPGPAGAHQGSEGELGQAHQSRQHKEHSQGNPAHGTHGETQNGQSLHDQGGHPDPTLTEPIEQTGVEGGDQGRAERVDGAHQPGRSPVVIDVVQGQHDAQTHHAQGQTGQNGRQAETGGARVGEQAQEG